MPDLDFGETDEEAILVLKGFAHRVNTDLYNHGTKGLLTQFNTFIAEHNAREEEQKRIQESNHRENSQKINLLIAIATIAGVIIAAVGLLITVEVSHKAQFDPAKIFHSLADDQIFAKTHAQDAGSSIAVHY